MVKATSVANRSSKLEIDETEDSLKLQDEIVKISDAICDKYKENDIKNRNSKYNSEKGFNAIKSIHSNVGRTNEGIKREWTSRKALASFGHRNKFSIFQILTEKESNLEKLCIGRRNVEDAILRVTAT